MKRFKTLNILTIAIMILFVTTAFVVTSPKSKVGAGAKVTKPPVTAKTKIVKPPVVTKNITKAKAAQTIQAKISNFAFNPIVITINKGDTVIWTNLDSMGHTVTSTSFDSGNLGKNATFKYTFNTVGTFNYVCSYHPNMTGTVIVK